MNGLILLWNNTVHPIHIHVCVCVCVCVVVVLCVRYSHKGPRREVMPLQQGFVLSLCVMFAGRKRFGGEF